MIAAYQGEAGSNSATAARALYPESAGLPCTSFEQALDAVTLGAADVAVIPVDNSAAGRVADVHHLLPDSGLFIIAEYFLAIRFDLVGVDGATLDQVEYVRSHVHALGQCRKVLREGGWRTLVSDDTAGGRPARPPRAPRPPCTASRYCAPVSRTTRTTPRASSCCPGTRPRPPTWESRR